MTKTLSVISDFNAASVGGYLSNSNVGEDLSPSVAPYGQVFQNLTQQSDQSDYSFVWTRPEGVLATFREAIDMNTVDERDVIAEVDMYANALIQHAANTQYCFVSAWVLPRDQRGYGILDWQPGVGLAGLLAKINLHLAERLSAVPNVYLLDAQRWQQVHDKPASQKMWYVAKVPYSNAVFAAAAADVARAIIAVNGHSKRLIVVDLDDTLWGGIVGETGWEGLRLGGHDHIGEAFVGFQQALKALSKNGIQLAIVSKNEEQVGLEAIVSHPEMVLRVDDFAAWRINWRDKAQNVADLVSELRLGLSSVVFLDDNPAERERVRAALPEVLVPEWPKDPCKYTSALHSLGVFDVASISEEDRGRTAMYVKDRERRQVADLSGSMHEYLEALDTKVLVSPLDRATLPRVAQLFNKTNQLNMSTRRLTQDEIADWSKEPTRSLFSLSVSDRFGDLGLTGIVSVDVVDGEAEIVDYVLSCRVMGRQVEEAMISVAVDVARSMGARSLKAQYQQTARNAPTLRVLRESSLTETEEHAFVWDCAAPYQQPAALALTHQKSA